MGCDDGKQMEIAQNRRLYPLVGLVISGADPLGSAIRELLCCVIFS
jgi:hypothetical protein